jgi:hypothetical protein
MVSPVIDIGGAKSARKIDSFDVNHFCKTADLIKCEFL